jgi:hypothetical protein
MDIRLNKHFATVIIFDIDETAIDLLRLGFMWSGRGDGDIFSLFPLRRRGFSQHVQDIR